MIDKIQQNLLNFKLEVTSDCITAKSGLLVFVKLAEEVGLTKLIHCLFGRPGSNRGIRAYDYVMSILLMLIGGGKYLEDIRQI
ncbi:MAG: IS1380 family transposase, partial [Thermoanaerobaculia bacterium]